MGRDDLIPVVSLAFAAGAASATLLWWNLLRKHVDNENVQQEFLQKLEGMRAAGIPRWPSWEDVRRSVVVDNNNNSNNDGEIIKTPVRPQDKTGLCIGNIFGMDAGGTLTKLVYFEERSPTTTTTTVNVEQHPHLQMPSADETSSPTKGDNKQQRLRRTSSADLWVFPSTAAENGHHARGDSLPNLSELIEEDDTGTKAAKSRDHAEALDSFYSVVRGFSQFQSGVRDTELSFYSKELGGDFHFIQFETRQMETAMDLIRSNKLHSSICEMGATGGGAHKYAPAWERVLGIKILKEDELDSLVAGMQFVLSTVVGECYTFIPRVVSDSSDVGEGVTPSKSEDESDSDHNNSDEIDDNLNEEERTAKGDEWWWSRKVKRDAISPSATYPYLLVTIGTGVSILRVDGPRKHVRVSGSTIGGGTYWGLIRLLTSIDNFQNVLKMAERGDSSKIDMMVGDIYGTDSKALEKVGLPSNLVASSFGKLVAKQDPAAGLSQEDLARALLLMVTNNIGQVAYLNAKLNKTPRIYFVGNFLRNNKISQRRLAYAINYWSKGEMEALFLEREGYLGALGAFLLCQGVAQTDNGFFKRESKKTASRSKK